MSTKTKTIFKRRVQLTLVIAVLACVAMLGLQILEVYLGTVHFLLPSLSFLTRLLQGLGFGRGFWFNIFSFFLGGNRCFFRMVTCLRGKKSLLKWEYTSLDCLLGKTGQFSFCVRFLGECECPGVLEHYVLTRLTI